MSSKIVMKLFGLTTLLCTFILAIVFIGQTFFFKHYYVQKKVADIQEAIYGFESNLIYYKDSSDNRRKEYDFYTDHNVWITTLDQDGKVKNMDDFYLEIEVDNEINALSEKRIRIPLYYLMDIDDMLSRTSPLMIDTQVSLYGIKTKSAIIPYVLSDIHTAFPELREISYFMGFYDWNQEGNQYYWENKRIKENAEKLVEGNPFLLPHIQPPDYSYIIAEDEEAKFELVKKITNHKESPIVLLTGKVSKIHLPDENDNTFNIYNNGFFMEKIKDFQASILFKQTDTSISEPTLLDEEHNGVQHKIFIQPFQIDGQTNYIYAMTSLQPVDDVLQVIENYYVYLIIIVMVLVLLVSFYYSKKIASPLLKINETTKKIAELDFSENVPVKSKDELGTLSQNINTLSSTLHTYIHQLQEDVEKEKQLERTRKEFVSGVSHELKTPLSIMKSIISILESNIATEKKDYYFQALEQEVDRMDRLIVDMLDLAKYESGTYQMKTDVFYIDEMIERIYRQLYLTATNKNLYFYKNVQPIQVVANEYRIEQVITNFVTNAIRHTDEKGEIIISTIDKNDKVKVTVENTGRGIEQNQIDKLWDRFYRGDMSRQRSKGETGLGLAISKNILELHGSEFGVFNTDKGVMFYFYIKKNNHI